MVDPQVRRMRRAIGAVVAAAALTVAIAAPALAQGTPPTTEAPTTTAPRSGPAVGPAGVASIGTAMKGELAGVAAVAEGGFDGGDTLDITLTVTNRTAEPVVLAVPRGALFASDDHTEQIAVTSGPADEVPADVSLASAPTITVEPGTHEVDLEGFCAQALDSGPDDVVPLAWAGVAADPLPIVLANIARQGPDPVVAQDAVWWVTDDPVLPVPERIEPLLEGVDTEAFGRTPTRVVPDERYTPAWKTDTGVGPLSGGGPGAWTDDGGITGATEPGGLGGGGGWKLGLFLALFVATLIAVIVIATRRPSNRPALAQRSAPAGWHPDPRDPNRSRYWDGRAWTDHTRPR